MHHLRANEAAPSYGMQPLGAQLSPYHAERSPGTPGPVVKQRKSLRTPQHPTGLNTISGRPSTRERQLHAASPKHPSTLRQMPPLAPAASGHSVASASDQWWQKSDGGGSAGAEEGGGFRSSGYMPLANQRMKLGGGMSHGVAGMKPERLGGGAKDAGDNMAYRGHGHGHVMPLGNVNKLSRRR